MGCYKIGMTPEEIDLEYSYVTLAPVHAASAYDHANRQEIETDIAEDDEATSEWEQELMTESKRRIQELSWRPKPPTRSFAKTWLTFWN